MKKFLIILFSLVLIFFARNTIAAELNFSPSSGSYNVGDTVKVRIVLSSPSQSANAVSGAISFSKDLLSLTSISKTGSLVGIWAVEPSYSNTSGVTTIEGVILNGYTGSSGTIATLFFKAKATGNAEVKFTSSSVLANDGEGTNILTKSGEANFNIAKAVDNVVNYDKSSPSIQIEELKKKDEMASSSKFLITSTGKKAASSYKVEIDGAPYSWTNSESNIYETPTLSKGTHILKVLMDTINDNTISNSISFTINTILVPTFTEYSENIKEKEYIVAKGLADPNVFVVINSNAVVENGNQALNKEVVLKADEKGFFAYVSEKATAGVYEITAHARTKSGVESEKSLPVKVTVQSSTSPISSSIMNAFSFLVPLLALMILLIILAIWGWYKVLYYKENLHKKFTHTKSLISKSFDILDEDVDEQIKILKKIKALQPLTEDDRNLINQFKKDIEEAEKTILNEVKE